MTPAPREPNPYVGWSVTVMGLGLFGGGASVCRFLAERGAEVTVTDLRDEVVLEPALRDLRDLPLRLVLGRHLDEDFTQADLVVANPAVPPHSPFLELARQAGVRVTSEVALFLRHARARICAVTGTQGKSSTCNLLANLLRGTGQPVHLGGNIGSSLLERVDQMAPTDHVVLELSSYQLEALALEGQIGRVFECGAILNILEDHLERHGSFDAYATAKRQLARFVEPGGKLLVPAGDPCLAEVGGEDTKRVEFSVAYEACALRLSNGQFVWQDEVLALVDDLRLPGVFQRANALVALGMARVLGVPTNALAALLRSAQGLPHRLEDLGSVRGCRVWDNAVSTTPDSTVAALDSLESGLTLLVGGQSKRLPLAGLSRSAAQRTKRVICFGADAARLARELSAGGAQTHIVNTVGEAVTLAFRTMKSGEALLFSPAAASFDAYPNFRARAEDFRAALRSVDRGTEEPCV